MSAALAMPMPENDPFSILQNALDPNRVLIQQTIASVRADVEAKSNPNVPLPHISPSSKHFQYAVLIYYGYHHTDACRIIGCKVRTADGWRLKLRAEARARYGFDVEYECIVRDIVEAAIASLNKPRLSMRFNREK